MVWFSTHIADIIVIGIVLVLMALAVVKIVKDRKAGIMACDQKCEHCHGNCANCSGCAAMHPNTK